MADRMTHRPLSSELKRLARASRRGTTLVEAAFVIPVLMAVTIGGIEFGTLLHLRQSMLHAARESARVLAIESGNATQAETVALDLLPSEHLPWIIELTAPAPDAVDRDVVSTISIPMSEISMADFFGIFGPDDHLSVSVTMRSEQ